MLEDIKNRLRKEATIFKTGGFRPTNSKNESWIGRVYLYKKDEEIPFDKNGDLMYPLFQLCLKDLPFVPKLLKNTKVLTVFISKSFSVDDVQKVGDTIIIREYSYDDELIIKDLKNEESFMKAFALKAEYLKEDYPVWDCEETYDIQDEIIKLEESGVIQSYFDFATTSFEHKIGGYASFRQSGIYFGDDYEFVFQISSDEKANLEFVDDGALYFAKNSKDGTWVYYCDFY